MYVLSPLLSLLSLLPVPLLHKTFVCWTAS